MYRSVALAALERDRPPAEVAPAVRIELGDRVLLDGRDVTEAIRTPEVSEAASVAAAQPEVRQAMVAEQRRLLAEGDWVAEGRDIGTVVAPEAEVKVFLTASPRGARPAAGRRSSGSTRPPSWPSRRSATSATPAASTPRCRRRPTRTPSTRTDLTLARWWQRIVALVARSAETRARRATLDKCP